MKTLITLLLLLIMTSVRAQDKRLSIYFNNYLGLWSDEGGESYRGGGGLAIEISHDISGMQYIAGIEYRSINWGSSLSLLTGLRHDITETEKIKIQGASRLGLGTALFRKHVLFQFSLDYIPEIQWKIGRGHLLTLGAGLRYTNCPSYQKYGALHQILEVPVLFSWTKELL